MGDCTEVEGNPLPATGQARVYPLFGLICVHGLTLYIPSVGIDMCAWSHTIYTHTYTSNTSQVAAQEGAYVARLLNRGYDLSLPVPTFPIDEGMLCCLVF